MLTQTLSRIISTGGSPNLKMLASAGPKLRFARHRNVETECSCLPSGESRGQCATCRKTGHRHNLIKDNNSCL